MFVRIDQSDINFEPYHLNWNITIIQVLRFGKYAFFQFQEVNNIDDQKKHFEGPTKVAKETLAVGLLRAFVGNIVLFSF